MPLASLLGVGDPRFTQILDPFPKIQAKNIALVGVRSYEMGELELLRHLNVGCFLWKR